MNKNDLSIAVSLGHGVWFAIDNRDHLLIEVQGGDRIYLGPATKQNLSSILSNMQRLSRDCKDAHRLNSPIK